MYKIEFTKEAIKDASRLRKSDMQSYKKLDKLINELKEHPTRHGASGAIERESFGILEQTNKQATPNNLFHT